MTFLLLPHVTMTSISLVLGYLLGEFAVFYFQFPTIWDSMLPRAFMHTFWFSPVLSCLWSLATISFWMLVWVLELFSSEHKVELYHWSTSELLLLIWSIGLRRSLHFSGRRNIFQVYDMLFPVPIHYWARKSGSSASHFVKTHRFLDSLSIALSFWFISSHLCCKTRRLILLILNVRGERRYFVNCLCQKQLD